MKHILEYNEFLIESRTRPYTIELLGHIEDVTHKKPQIRSKDFRTIDLAIDRLIKAGFDPDRKHYDKRALRFFVSHPIEAEKKYGDLRGYKKLKDVIDFLTRGFKIKYTPKEDPYTDKVRALFYESGHGEDFDIIYYSYLKPKQNGRIPDGFSFHLDPKTGNAYEIYNLWNKKYKNDFKMRVIRMHEIQFNRR